MLSLGIAFRYLRARKGDGFVSILVWFSLIGILLGVATLIIVMSVMNGFRHDLQTRILGLNGHITIETPLGIPNYDSVVEALESRSEITHATPLIDQQVLVTGGGRVTGALARGILSDDLRDNPLLKDALMANVKNFDHHDGVILGQRMAWNLGLSIGDTLTITAPQANRTALGSSPRRKTYPVAGTFSVGMSEYDSSYIFMPLAQAQKLFRLKERVMKIEMRITDPDQAIELSPTIGSLLPPTLQGVHMLPWQHRHASFFQALQVERNVMFLILSLVVIVAAFNIIISQVMMVRDKSSSIAILRAAGASRRMIMGVFFWTGVLIGGFGTLIGVILGVIFALNIETIRQFFERLLETKIFSAEVYFLSTLPSRLEMQDMLNIVTLSLSLTFVASLYAAWQAVRVEPVQVLRHAR